MKYINTDLICYWENKPEDLYSLQIQLKIIKKLKREEFEFNYTLNILPIKQKTSIEMLKSKLIKLDDVILHVY